MPSSIYLSSILFIFLLSIIFSQCQTTTVNYYNGVQCQGLPVETSYSYPGCRNSMYSDGTFDISTCNSTGIYYSNCNTSSCSPSSSCTTDIQSTNCLVNEDGLTSLSVTCTSVDSMAYLFYGSIKVVNYVTGYCNTVPLSVSYKPLNTCSYHYDYNKTHLYGYYTCSSSFDMQLIKCTDNQCKSNCYSTKVSLGCNSNDAGYYTCIPSNTTTNPTIPPTSSTPTTNQPASSDSSSIFIPIMSTLLFVVSLNL